MPFNHIIKIVIAVSLLIQPVMPGLAETNAIYNNLTQTIQANVKKQKDKKIKIRLNKWEKLLHNNSSGSDMEKVKRVNDFFNNQSIVDFAEDIYVWKEKDYWATPIEFMIKGYGDCEDYAIAKYFSLLSLGLADKDLRITYVQLKNPQRGGNIDLAHMVLTYYPKGSSTPLVLDNINRKLLPASKREDLKFVYSFNGEKLWLAKNRQYGVYIGESRKISKWAELKEKFSP